MRPTILGRGGWEKSSKQQQRDCPLPITSLPTTWQTPFFFYPDLDVPEQNEKYLLADDLRLGTPTVVVAVDPL